MPFNIAQYEKEEAITYIARRVAEATGAQEVWALDLAFGEAARTTPIWISLSS